MGNLDTEIPWKQGSYRLALNFVKLSRYGGLSVKHSTVLSGSQFIDNSALDINTCHSEQVAFTHINPYKICSS